MTGVEKREKDEKRIHEEMYVIVAWFDRIP